ncbi:hypothetical protein ACFVSW_04805 [Neobacillus sp. NPDC058068]|uniref:hypothetical protein n=1 Tax=Neobacillus sp. NPDC058068 TaxID=3346325 RepID=UPI0036DEC89E
MITANLRTFLHSNSSLLFSSKEEKNNWWKNVRNASACQPLINEIRAEGKRLLQEADQELTFSLFRIFTESGERLEFEKIYFEKRRRLTTFTILVLLEPERHEYVMALENTIWSICNEYSWCLPAHLLNSPETSTVRNYSLIQPYQEGYTIDLFAAETAFALSEILKLTDDYLNPLICKRIYQEVYKRIFHPFKETQFEWETQTHNWAAVCAGSIGAAALHLMDDANELAIVLERVLPAMESYLKGFHDDGICLEGYGYWQYGFGFYVYFADLLKKKTSGKVDLFHSKKVHQIALFQQKCFLNRNLVINFSDALPTASVFLGLSHYLSKLYSDFEVPERALRAKYTDDHCSRWAHAIRNLLWFDEFAHDQPWGQGATYSKESEWFISRYQSEYGSFSFAAKGGHNDEPHNHNDVGHFILHGNNEVFFKDLGSGLYSKDYFREKRYSFLCNGSQGHSVPIINYQYQSEGSAFHSDIRNVSCGDEVETFELDLANSYESSVLKTLIRKFTWIKSGQPKLILEDYYSCTEKPISIVERFITPALSITADEEGVILEGKQRLKIVFDRSQLDLKVNSLEFINHFGEREENLALDFTIVCPDKECNAKLIFQFE